MTIPRNERLKRNNERWRKRTGKDPEQLKKSRDQRAFYHLRKKYGLSRERYERMLKSQCGACAICGIKPKGRRLAVDEDHETESIRGLLCLLCNLMLGYADDSVEILLEAILYLGAHDNEQALLVDKEVRKALRDLSKER